MNTIEERLWNYIDGIGSTDEQAAVARLIAENDVYKKKYEELLKLNADFAAIDLDEPSMGFTYNVMQNIRTENARQPLKAAIDKRIIWGIAAFFVLTIAVLLIVTLSNINWSAGGSHVSLPVQFKMPNMSEYFNGTALLGFIFFDVVLCLYLVDAYLRNKMNTKQVH